jgi:hypothetical protein
MARVDPAIPTTLRLTAHDRALLDELVAREAAELADRGVDVNASSVIRQLIRQAAKAHGIVITEPTARPPRLAPRPPAATQDEVRALYKKRARTHRGLGAELSRALGVEAAQLSRFKAGHPFPASKLDALHALLTYPKKDTP